MEVLTRVESWLIGFASDDRRQVYVWSETRVLNVEAAVALVLQRVEFVADCLFEIAVVRAAFGDFHYALHSALAEGSIWQRELR